MARASKKITRRPKPRAAAKPKTSSKRRTVAVKKGPAKKKVAARARPPAATATKPARKPARKAGPAPKKVPAKPKSAAKPALKPPVPKVVAKPQPPPPPPPPKKPRKPELTPKEIAKVRATLEEQRAIFAREYSEIEEGAFNVSQSEMSGEVSFDEDSADAGSFTFEREKELSIGQNIRDLLDKVEHALAAIARGTYGLCENCGDPISKARLLALPYSTMCIKCKKQEERTR